MKDTNVSKPKASSSYPPLSAVAPKPFSSQSSQASGETVVQKKAETKTATPSTLESVESIVNYIKKLPNYDELVADAVESFARDGLELPDNKQVETYQADHNAWMRKMIDIVK